MFFIRFLDQIKQIQDGGLGVLHRKLRILLLAIPAIPLVIVLRILRPFVVIRLGRRDSSRIGGIYHVDWYLAEKRAGMHKGKYFDIFYFVSSLGSIGNRQFLKMYKRVLPFSFGGEFAHIVDKVNRCFAGYKPHVIPLHDARPSYHVTYKENETLKCVLDCREPFIAFTPKEEIFGQKALHELGVPERTPFICFHARDSAYLDAIYPSKEWSYHDHRDSNIHNYFSVAEKLVERGYYAIRMGSVVKESLAKTNPAIIDYATNGKRADFMDIFLGAKCRFFICSEVGISIVPEVFKRPVVYVNWPSLGRPHMFVNNSLMIPKKLYLRKECRFLTFQEIINSEAVGYRGDGKKLEQLGINFIENAPEEIIDVVIEMDERLKGTWKTTQEDEELQKRFWSFFGKYQLKNSDLRVGAKFLRQNRELLKMSECVL